LKQTKERSVSNYKSNSIDNSNESNISKNNGNSRISTPSSILKRRIAGTISGTLPVNTKSEASSKTVVSTVGAGGMSNLSAKMVKINDTKQVGGSKLEDSKWKSFSSDPNSIKQVKAKIIIHSVPASKIRELDNHRKE